jgi:signal peptidase II
MNEAEREGAAVPPPPAQREGAAVPPPVEVRRADAPKRTLPAVVSGWRWLPLSAAVIVADRIVKLWMTHHFAPLERVHVLKVLDIILTYNTGAAFSFLADASGWQRWLFVLLALGVSAALIVWMRRLDARVHGLLACGLALIVGGALGNMIDRIATGRVVDFIHVHWGAHYFPAFNIADSAITIGAALLLLDAWHESRRARRLRI